MTIGQWQSDAHRAFSWISDLYEQAQTAWEDADSFFREEQWTPQCGNGFGGIAMSTSDLREWPFVYFKVMGAFPPEDQEGKSGRAAFFGILFHDSKRTGPTCVAGTASWSDEKTTCDHWIMLAAIGSPANDSYAKAFDVTAGPIHRAQPTAKGAKLRRGIGDLRWFEIPLGAVTSAQRLRDIVHAAEAMVREDDAPAITLVRECGVEAPPVAPGMVR